MKRAEFAERAAAYGLEAEDHGRLIQLEGTHWHVSGLAPPALRRKFPVTCSRVEDGEVEAFSILVVRGAIRRARAAAELAAKRAKPKRARR